MKLTKKLKAGILAHAEQCYPAECCGAIVLGRYIPCRNVAEQGQFEINHEDLAKALGATEFQFIVMQDGIDFACHADFGNGMEPFYPDTPTNRFYQQG